MVQLVADLTGLRVERPVEVEMSSLGCAHIVGLQLGKIFFLYVFIYVIANTEYDIFVV